MSKTSRMAEILEMAPCATWLINCAERFQQPGVPIRIEGRPGENPQIKKRERCSDRNQGDEIPDTHMQANTMQRRQDHDIDVHQLNKDQPARNQTKLSRLLLW